MFSRFVCVTFALFALINVVVGEIHTECPSDPRWIKHGNKCYFIERINRSFDRAKQRCEAMGATMLTIESKEENEFIEQTFTRITAYLGATRVPGTDKWRWPDGRFVEWFNWNDGEPNNWRDNENCIQFYNNIGYPGKWNDYGCGRGESTLCQIVLHTDDEESQKSGKKCDRIGVNKFFTRIFNYL